ncbi:hypothetical protein K504DRAFT_459692 [Pleomassaria siparia CBS 279.74]|uniref:Uncharacterized protein n=1 Tax=Pleomassaria siparia CBS 279.74 TaxID=1314801 RepID=A0A6G1K1Y4_9PLEO|nr:hypothetical protein K504DRAFT_459692 [Pleomassaria siparia CBS 279.74]
MSRRSTNTLLKPSSRMMTVHLEKFSYTGDLPAVKLSNFKWFSMQQDLIVVFDTFRGEASGAAPQMMKVLQGTRVLEEIPLGLLVTQNSDTLATMQKQSVKTTVEDLPLGALTKRERAIIALRWLVPTKKDRDASRKMRRVQLKFVSVQDFDIVHDQLQQLGVRLSEQPGPKEQPNATHSYEPIPHNHPSPGTTESLFPSSNPRSSPYRPATSTSPSSLSFGNPSTSDPSYLQRHESTYKRPMSAHAAMSGPQYSDDPYRTNPLIPPEYFPMPFTSSSTFGLPTVNMPTSNTPEPVDARPGTAMSDVRPGTAFSTSCPGTAQSDLRPDTAVSETRSGTGFSNGRLYTAFSDTRPGPALQFSGLDPNPVVIPPRRELPFGRSPTGKATSHSASRPTSSASHCAPMGPPPPPTQRRNEERRPSTSPTFPPLPMPTIVDRTTFKTITPPSSSPQRVSGKPIVPAENACTSRGPAQTQHGSQASALERIVEELSRSNVAQDKDGLAAYAMQSEEARKAVLNDFMMRHIDDDNFLTLVEDMSGCWSSIGLGL